MLCISYHVFLDLTIIYLIFYIDHHLFFVMPLYPSHIHFCYGYTCNLQCPWKKARCPLRMLTLSNEEFIRRFLMHVFTAKFQKNRYYGFLNNRMKSQNLKLIFKPQGYQKFKQWYTNLGIANLIKQIKKKDICCCLQYGHSAMKLLGKTHGAFGQQHIMSYCF